MNYAVLGGGISGLSTAFYLYKGGKYGVRLYESSNRVGGWINSVTTKNGTLFELGPRMLRSTGLTSENTLSLIEELGLQSSIIPITRNNEAANKRMLFVQNQLVPTPRGFGSLFRIKPPYMRPLIYALWHDIRTPKKHLDDDSVYNFLARRFGEEYAEVLGSSLVCGVFAGDSKEISVRAILQKEFQNEQLYGGVFAGAFKNQAGLRPVSKREETLKWTAWSLQGGLHTLPQQLKTFLDKATKANICLEKRCTRVEFRNKKAILTIDGQEETADHVFSSLPSRELAKILGPQYSFLKTELSAIPFVTVAVVNLQYEADALQDKLFGVLVPPNQKIPVLGVLVDSSVLPQEGKTVLTVLMGGRWFEKYFGNNPQDEYLLQTALNHVRKILKIDKNPVDSIVRVLRNCLPQYVVGHSRRVESIREHIAKKELPLSLIGNSYDGVGIHDAIMSAKTNVQRKLDQEKETLNTPII